MEASGGDHEPTGLDPKKAMIARSVPKKVHKDAMLAWEMNGVPLPNAHGGPLRMVTPGYFGINNVKPFAPLAKPFAAVPKITASIRTMYAIILLTFEEYSYFVILSTNFLIGGPTRRAAIIAIGRLTDHALKKRSTYSLSIPVFI